MMKVIAFIGSGRISLGGLLAALLWTGGCAASKSVVTPERYENGLVIVLPGIEGAGPISRGIVRGLDEGGVTSAIELYDWSVGVPGAFLINLAHHERNLEQARRIAAHIVEYRDAHPGAPVSLIGHSGGGGIAVLALEALPAGRRIDMAILLAAAVWPEHNLGSALRRADRIYNFHSDRDVGFLKLGTTLFGDIDREYGPSAGAIGFRIPGGIETEERDLYKERLRQVAWQPSMKRHGVSGGHFGWASPRFAREYLAPMIVSSEARRQVESADVARGLARPVPVERDSRKFRRAEGSHADSE